MVTGIIAIKETAVNFEHNAKKYKSPTKKKLIIIFFSYNLNA